MPSAMPTRSPATVHRVVPVVKSFGAGAIGSVSHWISTHRFRGGRGSASGGAVESSGFSSSSVVVNPIPDGPSIPSAKAELRDVHGEEDGSKFLRTGSPGEGPASGRSDSGPRVP